MLGVISMCLSQALEELNFLTMCILDGDNRSRQLSMAVLNNTVFCFHRAGLMGDEFCILDNTIDRYTFCLLLLCILAKLKY